METSSRFFRGSELPRLLVLAAVMVMGWGLFWHFLQQRPQPAELEARVEALLAVIDAARAYLPGEIGMKMPSDRCARRLVPRHRGFDSLRSF